MITSDKMLGYFQRAGFPLFLSWFTVASIIHYFFLDFNVGMMYHI